MSCCGTAGGKEQRVAAFPPGQPRQAVPRGVQHTRQAAGHGDHTDLPSRLGLAERPDEGDLLPIRRPHGIRVVGTIGHLEHRVRTQQFDRDAAARCTRRDPRERDPGTVWRQDRPPLVTWLARHGRDGLRLGNRPAVGLHRRQERVIGGDTGECERSHRSGGGQRGMTSNEARGPSSERVAARANRLGGEMPPKVVGQVGDGRVAIERLLLQRLPDDGIEITLEQPVQALRGRPAVRRPSRGIGLRIRSGDHSGRWHGCVDLDDRFHQIGRRGDISARMLSREQNVEQHTQRVDIRGGGHCSAADLLRCGISRCEGPAPLECHGRRLARVVVPEQLGNPEVQQLHVAVCTHEHVRRLDIAVDDAVGMCVRHGAENVEKQFDARAHVEPPIVAVAIDRLPVHEFEHEVRLAVRRDARVDQMGDVGMREASQDVGLAAESRLRSAEPDLQQLDGDLGVELAIAALREPDDPHAALTDR